MRSWFTNSVLLLRRNIFNVVRPTMRTGTLYNIQIYALLKVLTWNILFEEKNSGENPTADITLWTSNMAQQEKYIM